MAISLKTGLDSILPPRAMMCAEFRTDTFSGYL